jgi:hypothetical protein
VLSGRSGDLTKRDSSADQDAEPASDRASSDLGIRYRKQDVQRDANALGGSHQHRPCCGAATPAAQTLRLVSRRPSRQGGRDLRKRELLVMEPAHAGHDRDMERSSSQANKSHVLSVFNINAALEAEMPLLTALPLASTGADCRQHMAGRARRGGDRDYGTSNNGIGRRTKIPAIWEARFNRAPGRPARVEQVSPQGSKSPVKRGRLPGLRP